MFTGICSWLFPYFFSFFITPPQIYSFIYLASYRATSALRISTVPQRRVTHAPRCSKHVHVCVFGDAVKMPHPAVWWSPPNPPNSHLPQKGSARMQRPTGGHRCAHHGHTLAKSRATKQSLRRGFRGGGKKRRSWSGWRERGAAVNQQINSQTDQSRPQYPHANGRTCLRPVPGMLESNWEHRLCFADLPMQQKTNE